MRKIGFPAIVTRFYLMTRPLPELYQSIYIYPISEYRKVLQWVIDVGLFYIPRDPSHTIAQYREPPNTENLPNIR